MGNIQTEHQNEITENSKQGLIDLVCNCVDSKHTKRAYARALSEFLDWHLEQQGKRKQNLPLTKALVQEYKVHLEIIGRGTASINQALSAIRKLAQEASDNGLISEQIGNGIKNVKGIKQEGTRTGNWLTREQAQQLINSPDVDTLKGARDRAILAVLVGCGLRRLELATLTWGRIQQREGRWVIVDLVGKRNKTRSVPMPSWAKAALDHYGFMLLKASGSIEADLTGVIFVSVNKGDNVSGDSMTPQAVRDVVVKHTQALNLDNIAAHDLRRTFAKLARKGGSDLEQIQLSLGHASIKTTQRYLGTQQDLTSAPCDVLGLSLE